MQIGDSAKQLEQVRQGAVPAGAHCAAIDAVEQENDILRNSLQAERDAKMDKLDSENLSISMEQDIVDAELIEEKKANRTLRGSTEAAMQELRVLRKMVKGQQGAIGKQDHRDLLDLVATTTQKNKDLVEVTAKTDKMLQEIQRWGCTVEDKCESEVMKANQSRDYWRDRYYNDALPTTERLHAGIAALKAEKGEKHSVESAPPANPVVFGRKMLPCATH